MTHDSKCSSWKIILSDVFGPLQFLIDINDLSDGLISICNIFSEDMSIFSKVFYQDKSERDLNNDLFIISERACQWKIEFNPDPNSPVHLCESQKHLGFNFEKYLNFHGHYLNFHGNKICNKLVDTIKHLSVHLPRKSLLSFSFDYTLIMVI